MAAEPPSKRALSDRRFKEESKPTRVKDDVKPTSLKREAESQDQSYIFPSNSRNHSVDSHQPRQRKKQKLQVSPIRANIVAIPDHERRYDRTCNSSSRMELSIDDRCETPLESTWVMMIFSPLDQGYKFAFVFKCECDANATASQNANANAMRMRRLCEFWMRMRCECVAFFRIRIFAFSHFSANRKMRICENANANRKMRNAIFFNKKW